MVVSTYFAKDPKNAPTLTGAQLAHQETETTEGSVELRMENPCYSPGIYVVIVPGESYETVAVSPHSPAERYVVDAHSAP